jgi:RHS repeat-associated protein
VYDTGARLTAMTDKTGTATIFSGQFSYDAAGLTKSAAVTLPLEPALTPQSTAITYDAANQIKAVDGVAFTFDADGNLTSGTIEGVPTTLVYDALNRLLQRNADRYRYDTDNFRIETVRGGVTTRYVWDGASRDLRLLEEQSSNGGIVARYVHGAGLIGREDAATGTFSVYHFDQRGSTVALTNPAGVITDRYAYDPNGRVVGRQGSTPNPFTYVGRSGVFDDGNGFYYMTSRYYIPSLGRFAQQESIYRGSLMQPQSLNRYAYAGNNPVDRVDPRGEWGFPAIGALVGAVSGAVTQVASNVVDNKPWYKGVAGAALEGGINGAAILMGPAGQLLAGAAGTALGAGLNYGVDLATGQPAEFDIEKVGTDIAIGAAQGLVMGKIFPGPADPSKLLKNLPETAFPVLGGGKEAVTSAAQYIWKKKILDSHALKSSVWPSGTVLYKGILQAQFGSTDVAAIIKKKLGKTDENRGFKPSVIVADRWGIEPSASPWGSYLINQVTGVVPGNPQ